MRIKGAVAVVLRNCIHVRRVPCLDCVALHALLWCDAPAIVHAVYRGVSVVAYRHHRGTYIRQTLFLTSTMVDEEKWVCAELETRTEHLSSFDAMGSSSRKI